MNTPAPISDRILVLTPTGDDAAHAIFVLKEAGLNGTICEDCPEIARNFAEGAGALLIAEEALTPDTIDGLLKTLAAQPPWSDVPLLLITSAAESAAAGQTLLNTFSPHANITLIERPLGPISLVSALRAALRSRQRQYQLRDVLEEQQKALAGIREHERRFRAAVSAVSNLIWTNNARGEMEGEQPGWGSFTGQAREEYQGYGWATAVHPDDAQPTIDAWNLAVAEKRLFEFEHRLRRYDGEWRACAIRAVPVLDDAGELREWVGVHTDITERKRSEELLRDSEAQLVAATTAGAVGTWTWDLASNVLAGNPALARTFGLDVDEVRRGLPAEAYIAGILPEDQPAVEQAIARALAPDSDGIYEVEYRTRDADGKVRWLFSRGQVEYDAARKPLRLPGALTDITARKEAEEQLRRSAELLTVLIDRSPFGFLIVDADFRISHINADSQARAYRNVQPAIGRRLDEAMRILWPEPLATELCGIFRHTLATGEPYRSSGFIGSRRDLGIVETYEWQLERLTMTDGSYSVVSYYYDTTAMRQAELALRQSEARLRIATDAARLGIFVWHIAEDRTEWENEEIYRHFGRTAGDETINAAEFMEKTMHPDDRAAFREALAATLAGDAPFVFQCRFLREDGALRWIELHGQITHDADGAPLWMLGTTADITERKLAEEALRTAKEEAEAASRAKDHFLAQLSHELRTPLTPVLMTATALCSDHTLPDEVREQLAMVARNVSLEARLIDDLLDLTHITRGKLTLRAEPCDVHSLLGNVAGIVREDAREKQIDLVLDLRAEHHQLIGDPARLQQVFWNLLRNAVKFTTAGGHIHLRSHNGAGVEGKEQDARFCVEVSDNGIGFDPTAAARLFRPFEQEGGHNFGGLGLGLAIAHAIVAQHGGLIRAESAGRGRGATFTVELPGAVAVEAMEPTVGRTSLIAAVGDAPMRLLLVEDHVATCKVLSRLLRKAGHEVTTAGSVAEARAAAAQARFDAVISDLGLPDGTGNELMAHLRDAHGLRGIALSGYGMDEDVRRSREAGFSEHLVKPVDLADLRRAIRRIGAEADIAPPSSS